MHTIKNLLDHPITRNCARPGRLSNANETLDLLSITKVAVQYRFYRDAKIDRPRPGLAWPWLGAVRCAGCW